MSTPGDVAAVSLFAALTAACEVEAGELGAILPDDRLLVEPGAGIAALARPAGEPSPYAATTASVVATTNGQVAGVLELLTALTELPPTARDGRQIRWGPYDDDDRRGQLQLEARDDGSFGWRLALRAAGDAPDVWVPVLAGEIDAGATAARSAGRFWLDYTALDALGASGGLTGGLALDYTLREAGARQRVFFGALAAGEAVPTDGATWLEHDRGEGGRMDLVLAVDVAPEDAPGATADEALLLRSRWTATAAGRTDALLTGGDLGLLTFTETECWSATGTRVFYENNYSLTASGDADRCAFDDASFFQPPP